MVVIRLARCGQTHHPKYRVTVADQRRAATGKYIEVIGQFNPFASGQDEKLTLKMDRAKYWMSVGAQPTRRVKSLLKTLES